MKIEEGTKGTLTPLEGDLNTSPIPPPLRSPLFIVVTIHIRRLSQAFSRTVVSSPATLVRWDAPPECVWLLVLLLKMEDSVEGMVQLLPSAEHTAVENNEQYK